MYASPKEGTYNYKTPNFDGTFKVQKVKVLVLGESDKQYLIRLILPLANHRQYDQMKVRKHNVNVHGTTAPRSPRKVYDWSKAFWND
jgi:hypothetical protein